MSTLFASGEPDTSSVPTEASDEERMRKLVEVLSAYIEYYHGGAVEMVTYEDDRLTVRMSGACEGCSLAPVTLHGWVEGTVKQFFPDLQEVVAV
ncbi:MAG TPA: NifU family protein [Anaerolineae bacterium]|jgi:Fe-S cluster biogenesis protein NfuA|nr:NifU family protein [Anaerolineae bacterium]